MTDVSPELHHHNSRVRIESDTRRALIRLAELQTEAEQAYIAFHDYLGPVHSVEGGRLYKLAVATAMRLDEARDQYRRLGCVSI